VKIEDRTPYRTETGEIDILGRLQGTLKYGLTWYSRVQAQDTVIAVMEKQLSNSYHLLRNVTLPNTEINLPLVLVGPQGVSLINVTAEHGVYRAKDDEWGTIVGDRFVPAGINQVQRTLTFQRVLQVYLDRQGFKGAVVVDSILMAADPGMHIESTRPAVRIVMSDALERFAASLAQGRVVLNAPAINDVVQSILVGRQHRPAPEPAAASPKTEGSAFETYTPGQPDAQSSPAPSADTLDFAFDEHPTDAQAQSSQASDQAQLQAGETHARRPATPKRASSGLTGMQWVIVAEFVIFLCILVGFVVFFLYY
jgi:hypothetical protein